MAGDWAALTKQVREASDLVAIAGSYLALTQAGQIYKALCPFHDDTRPSLNIDPKWQNFKCWACGEHGDVFTLVQRMERCDFKQAREILAARAGIRLEAAPQDDARLRLLEVMKWAQNEYQQCLIDSPMAEQARAYIGERQLNANSVRNFVLGYAPAEGTWLTQRARNAGFSSDVLTQVGLIAPRDEGKGFYDRFRDRVMFPIRDVRGQTVGFGGRILPSSPYANRSPKYYNSTDTPLFQKSELLYGLDLAKHAAAAAGYLAVVEGYTDVMMAHQHGVAQVVATMGTALNAKHVHHLRRFAPRVVLVFDADAGGTTGVDRALEIFVSEDVELKIATLPEGLDPCDLLKDQGPAPFRKVLDSAVDALDFKLNQLLAQEGAATPAGQKRVVDAILSIMALAPETSGSEARVKQELLLTRIAHRLGLRQETVWARFGELRSARKREAVRTMPDRTAASATNDPPAASKEVPLERQLLTMLLSEPAFVSQAARAVQLEEITHPAYRRLLSGLYQLQARGEPADMDGLRGLIHDPVLITRALELQHRGLLQEDRPHWFKKILDKFEQQRSEGGKKRIREQLTAASDYEAQIELLRKLQNPTEGSGS